MLFLLAITLLDFSDGALEYTLEAETRQIDPARSVFIEAKLVRPKDLNIESPDLRERARGFSLAEDHAVEPVELKDGRVSETVEWRLVPEPDAEEYKIAPFAIGGKVAGPVYFTPPEPGPAATGGFELDPKKDFPPLSWRLVWKVLGALSGLALVCALAAWGLKKLARKVKEHRMSPIERAWAELGDLLKKNLPRKGKYKDFYVLLTRVVRRYIQRKYGIKAPHMTTEEFFKAFDAGSAKSKSALMEFLEGADMVKFAGVDATPEMAEAATSSAREYLRGDDAEAKKEETK